MTVRRKIGKIIFGLAISLPLMIGAQAQVQDNVSLRLNWYLGGYMCLSILGWTKVSINKKALI